MKKSVFKLVAVALVITLMATVFATATADMQYQAVVDKVAAVPLDDSQATGVLNAEDEPTEDLIDTQQEEGLTQSNDEEDIIENDDVSEDLDLPAVATSITGLFSDPVNTITKMVYDSLANLVKHFLGGLLKFFPTPNNWVEKEEYVSENFYEGMETFIDEPAGEAAWRVGYSSASLVEGFDLETEALYLGGYFQLPPLRATAVADDLRVRVFAIDDNSGRGTAIFAVLDGSGFTNNDVRTVRSMLADFAAENNIVSINVSATHVHSAIDIQGLGGNLLEALFLNPMRIFMGNDVKIANGKNPAYIENLMNKTVECAEEAFADLKAGSLSYSAIDVEDYIRDKRAPIVFDPNLNVLHFVPDEGGAETYITTLGAHLTGFSQSTDVASSDYIYYIEQGLKDAYALEGKEVNFAFILGAQNGVTATKDPLELPEGTTQLEAVEAYGRRMAQFILENTQYTPLEPLFNIKATELFLKIDSGILLLAGKTGFVNNNAVITGNGVYDVEMVTEISYAELGTAENGIAFSFMPGEFMPELAWGGTFSAAESWTRTDWALAPMEDHVGGRRLLVCSQVNDAIGYIIPDNDFGSWLETEDHYEEMLSLGSTTGSTIVNAFEELVNSAR